MDIIDKVKTSLAYKDIKKFYGKRTAKRSGVPLINHIDEGLIILKQLHARESTMEAFCIHPLCQADEDIINFREMRYDNCAIFYAMEYRNIANKYLAHCDTNNIKLSPLTEVNLMLIADKVQNKKDFMLYHYGKHENSDRLLEYFNQWLYALGVTEERYQELVRLIS